MRVLVLGDLAGTGFGTVTRDLGRAMLARGLDCRFLSLNETPAGGLEEPFESRTARLGAADGWLASSADPDVAARTSERLERMFSGGLFEDGWAPDAAVLIGDMGSLKVSPVLSFLPAGFPAWHYVPIEGVGLPPSWGDVWRRVRPVACSEFGADQIARVTGTRPPVVYHGVDTDAFFPVSAEHALVVRGGARGLTILRSRAHCRRLLGWPQDEFVMFRADRHMPRKAYPSMLRAVAPVLDANPRARLIWHCATLDQGGDLADERSKYPRRIAERMNSTGMHDRYGGAPRELLAAMYNAADLYLSTSAEGFGLTVAESIACGVPAVGLGYSSVPEVIGPAGVTVPFVLVDNIYSHFWAVPVEPAYTEAVMRLMAAPNELRLMGARGPAHVREHFSWERAALQFARLLGAEAEEAAA